MNSLYVWLVILVLFVVAEGMTAGLTTIWFAGGALVAAIASYLGAGVVWQLILFICVSVVLLIFTRPLAVKYMKTDKTETNADSLVGRQAVVTERIDNLEETGQVRLGDIEWLARANNNTVIPKGSVVEICRIEGVKLIVEQKEEYKHE